MLHRTCCWAGRDFIAAPPSARHKKDLLLSKRSRPFLVTFSGEAEKVTARRAGALASHTRVAESLFQTPHFAPNREHFVPASSFALKRTPAPPQSPK
jgi:hypothetical protein